MLPLTCQHFLNLCTGYDEIKECYKDAYYINMHLHRIVKNGWIQCGGIIKYNLNYSLLCSNICQIFFFIGYENIICEINKNAENIKIPDESYCIPHDRRGILSMANNGKHSNESQFIVCLKSNPWMDHFYVAFG